MAEMDMDNNCFCELVPLYALGVLSQTEQAWIEQQIGECPELAEELAIYEAATTALPYSVADLPMAANLKQRLFERLELELPPLETAIPETVIPETASTPPPTLSYQAVRSQELNWQPHAVPGVEVAIVHADEVKREIVGFLRAASGVRYPWHRHAAIEEIFMISGDLVIDSQVYGAGDYIRSLPGSYHAPYTNGGCQFFFHTSMDDEYPELAAFAC